MASLQATTINGNATVTGTLSESGYIAYPLREYVINLSSQSATNFYPVAINNPPGADSTWHNQFSVDMASQGGGEAYNMHSMYGEVGDACSAFADLFQLAAGVLKYRQFACIGGTLSSAFGVELFQSHVRTNTT